MVDKTIVMITGVPGSGKTTLMEPLIDELKGRGLKTTGLDEYHYVEDWSKRDESQRWLLPTEGSFDISPSGYQWMSEYVGRNLANEIDREFGDGFQVLVFETARGVGEPRVDYHHLVDSIAENLEADPSQINLLNIEVRATAQEIEERIRARYLENPDTAPPPGIEKKYLNTEGQPLCLASRDLELFRLPMPLIYNEVVSNGRYREDLECKVRDEIFLGVSQALEARRSGPEGGVFWGGRERI